MIQSEERKKRAESSRRVIELNARYKELFAEVSSIKNAADNGTGRPLCAHRTFAEISRQLEAVTLKIHNGTGEF